MLLVGRIPDGREPYSKGFSSPLEEGPRCRGCLTLTVETTKETTTRLPPHSPFAGGAFEALGPAQTPQIRLTGRLQGSETMRAYEVFPLICPTCQLPLTFIAVLTDPEPIAQILAHIGEPTSPPLTHSAREPPQTDLDMGAAGGGAEEATQGSFPDDLNQSPAGGASRISEPPLPYPKHHPT